MTRLGFVATATVLLSMGSVARAQTTPLVYVFVTVDAVTMQNGALTVTGIKEGESSPSQEYVSFSSSSTSGALDSCNRMAVLAMTRPGQFLYTIDRSTSSYKCKLTRLNL